MQATTRHAPERQVRVVMTRENWNGRDMCYTHDDRVPATIQRAWRGQGRLLTVRGLGLNMRAKLEPDGAWYCYRGALNTRHRYRFAIEVGPL